MAESREGSGPETPKAYRQAIKAYEAEYANWLSRGKEIVKRYRDDAKPVSETKKRVWSEKSFNILWSNVQTILPALFARTPIPVCDRKFKDKDDLGRFAAEVVERIGRCLVSRPEYATTLQCAVRDMLLPGRGCVWVRYESTFGPPLTDPETGEIVLDEMGQPVLSVVEERVVPEYVEWDRFGHDCAKNESKIKLKWRVGEFDREDAEKRFGAAKAKDIEYNKEPKGSDKGGDGKDRSRWKTDIVELWDVGKKKVYWFQKDGGEDEFLDVKDDILQLQNFWPCPTPLYATLTNDSLTPVADFCYYQDIAEQLDEAVNRRRLLISAIRAVGAYNAAQPELRAVLKEAAENELIAVKNWIDFGSSGGIKGNMDFLPLEPLVKALQVLNTEIPQLKAEIYEITGISDIVRGTTAPNETATAQQLKGQFATLRLSPRQREVQRFARDLLQIMCELAVEKYDPATIAAIVNLESFSPEEQELFGPALELLRNDKLREYRIDIETDSMVAIDENTDREQRMEAVNTFNGFLKEAAMNLQQMPFFARSYGEMLKFMVRSFKGGRQLEHTIEQDVDAFIEQTLNPPPQQEPGPDPAMQQAQMDSQTKQMELQIKAQQLQLEQERAGVELQLKAREIAVREGELALKAQSETNAHQRESSKILADIAKGEASDQMAPGVNAAGVQSQPVALTINLPSQSMKKKVVLGTDPITGMKVGRIEDEPEILGVG